MQEALKSACGNLFFVSRQYLLTDNVLWSAKYGWCVSAHELEGAEEA